MRNWIDKDNYVTILGWMVTDLHLKGNELITYAIIYGFCGDDKWFGYSIPFLCDWLGLSYRGVMNVLQSLVKKGLLIKDDSLLQPKYKAVATPEKTSEGMKKVQGDPEKSSDNIDRDIDNTEIDKEKDTKVSEKKETKSEVVRFIPPTADQVREYCESRQNGIDADNFVDFYQSKGWLIGKAKMKDWKAAVRTWERKRKEFPTNPKQSKVGEALKRLNDMGITDDNTAF